MPQLDVITYMTQYVWLTLGLLVCVSLVTLVICYKRVRSLVIRSYSFPKERGSFSSSSPTLFSISKKLWSTHL